MKNVTYEELLAHTSTLRDYWIIDGDSRTYDLREEIKNWGGYWVPEHKCWRIDGLSRNDPAFKILRKIGLVLQVK